MTILFVLNIENIYFKKSMYRDYEKIFKKVFEIYKNNNDYDF